MLDSKLEENGVPGPEKALVLKSVWGCHAILRMLLWSRTKYPVVLRVEHLLHPPIRHGYQCFVSNRTSDIKLDDVDILIRGSSKCALPASSKATVTPGFSDNLDARTQPATYVRVGGKHTGQPYREGGPALTPPPTEGVSVFVQSGTG